MLGKLFGLCDNVINLNPDKIVINLTFKDEIRSFIIDLNRYNQLYSRGVDKLDNVIGEYSAFTEEITKGKKKAGTPYTLYDTGAFYKSFDVAVYSDNSFTIEADTIKEDGTDLARKFGSGILGLDPDSMNKLIEKLIPIMIPEVKKQILNV